MLIELYEVGNLRVVKWNHRVAPHHPGRLATSKSSPEVLLYMDEKSSARDVRYLDCSTFPPKASNKTISVAGGLQDYFLYDLCSISQGNDQLILSSFGYKGIYALDASTGNTKWKIFEKLSGMDNWMRARGIAADEQNHLFVCDADNQCVQRFSLNGNYLGPVLRYGDQNLGIPNRICWCHNTSSLVVAHQEKNGPFFIDVFTQE